MKSFKLNKNKGFSMVELLMVFVVILFASVVVFLTWPKLSANSTAQKENTQLSTLQAGIKSTFQGNQGYAGLTPAVLLNSNIVPNTMINDQGTPATADDKIVNSWGKEVAIAPAPLSGVANSAYAITYEAVPQAVCVKLATGTGLSFITVTVNATQVKSPTQNSVNIAAAATACAAGADENKIIFVGK